MTMFVAKASSCSWPTLGNACGFISTNSQVRRKFTSFQVITESLNIKDMAAQSILEGIGFLHHERKFLDVNIYVKGQLFCCHRVLLASVSTVLECNLAPGNTNDYPTDLHLDNNNVTPQLFASLLEILHTGTDPVTMKSVKDYLKMSAYLQIDFLTKYCEFYLSKNLTANVVLDFWKFAQANNFPNVAKICYTWAAENIDSLPQDEVLSLPKSMLLNILSLQKRFSMDDVCKTILSWVETDPDTRQTYLEELLPFVCFPHLSPSYLSDLLGYPLCRPNNILIGCVNQGVKFYMKRMDSNNANPQMEILAEQTVKLQLPDITSCCVVIGVQTELDSSPQGVFAISSSTTCYPLVSVPYNTGPHFASCTCQNAIYLSGGITEPNLFAVYRPGDNQWQVLPDLPGNGRAKHAMAAVNSCIYIIGGTLDERQPSLVLKYDMKSSTWHDFCWLPEEVAGASADVLGHRIYLFGGVNSDLVQCVDTRGCSAYIAGHLPYSTCTLRALSNGGIIHLVRSTEETLQMWETFDMAEKIEESLAAQKDGNLSQELRETISFVQVRKEAVRPEHFSNHHYFSACLLDGRILLLKGQRAEQCQLRSTIESIGIEPGDPCCEPIVLEGLVASGLYVLNVPQVHLTEALAESPDKRSESSNRSFQKPSSVLNSTKARSSTV